MMLKPVQRVTLMDISVVYNPLLQCLATASKYLVNTCAYVAFKCEPNVFKSKQY